MRQLLNTLFVTSEDIYLSLDGENVVASREHQEAARYPLHTLSGIVSFSYPGASPALMGACAERGISLAFCTPRGRFLARIAGSTSGNVLLRRAQYRTADELSASCRIARSMIFGKVYNARWSIERTRRDHGLRLDSASLTASASHLKELLPQIAAAAVRRGILSTPCSPLSTVCCRTTAPPHWRAWGWIPTWAFSTGIAPAGPLWPWI